MSINFGIIDSYFIIEVLCALIATTTYKYYKNTASRVFLFFIWYVVLNEFLGIFYVEILKNPYLAEILPRQNHWLYNIYSFISYFVFLSYYRKIVKGKKLQKMILGLEIIFILTVLLDVIVNFRVFAKTSLVLTRMVGSVGTLGSIFIYLFSLISVKTFSEYKRSLPFWITVGLMFFSAVTVPIFIFGQYFNFRGGIYSTILLLSINVLYGSFIVGFIMNAREQKIFQRQTGE